MKHSCPICNKATDSDGDAEFPFCGERCRLMDLGNWSSEKYVISRPAFDEEMLEETFGEKGSDKSDRHGPEN